MSRYADGWEFNGRSEMYLRETFDLFAADTADKSDAYKSGMRAIIEECHARAIAMNERSRVRVLWHSLYRDTVKVSGIFIVPGNEQSIVRRRKTNVVEQINAQLRSDSSGLYIPIRNR